jgi:hypothetical protein
MSLIPPKLPKPYASIKDFKITNSLRQGLELPSHLFTGELQDWAKIPLLLNAYFKESLVISKTGHALLTTISNCIKNIKESEEVLKAVKNYCGRLIISSSKINLSLYTHWKR